MNLEPPIPAEVLAAVRAPFADLGATPIDPPVMQPLGLILDLSGEAMRERLILVQADGGGEAALRPDFTIPAARLHIDSGRAGGRYFYEGKAFRAAPRGREAYEEFLQIGLEAFETGAAPEADAEIAAGQVTVKDLDLGRELAAAIKGHEAYREERPGQVTAPRSELVATVRAIVERTR